MKETPRLLHPCGALMGKPLPSHNPIQMDSWIFILWILQQDALARLRIVMKEIMLRFGTRMEKKYLIQAFMITHLIYTPTILKRVKQSKIQTLEMLSLAQAGTMKLQPLPP